MSLSPSDVNQIVDIINKKVHPSLKFQQLPGDASYGSFISMALSIVGRIKQLYESLCVCYYLTNPLDEIVFKICTKESDVKRELEKIKSAASALPNYDTYGRNEGEIVARGKVIIKYPASGGTPASEESSEVFDMTYNANNGCPIISGFHHIAYPGPNGGAGATFGIVIKKETSDSFSACYQRTKCGTYLSAGYSYSSWNGSCNGISGYGIQIPWSLDENLIPQKGSNTMKAMCHGYTRVLGFGQGQGCVHEETTEIGQDIQIEFNVQ